MGFSLGFMQRRNSEFETNLNIDTFFSAQHHTHDNGDDGRPVREAIGDFKFTFINDVPT
jgi:hypothetical protein